MSPRRPLKEHVRLTALRLAARLVPAPAGYGPSPVPPQRILLVRPDHLGDVLFTVPALRLLRRVWPNVHVTVVAGPWSQPVFERVPYIDEVIPCSFPWFSRQPKTSLFAPYRQLFVLAERLKARRFDTAVVLRFDHWWGAWLAHCAGIPRRLGYDVPEVTPFLTQAQPYRAGRHEVLQNLGLIESLVGEAAPLDNLALEFVPSVRDELTARELLEMEGVKPDDPLVCIHPGAGAPVKLWRNVGWAAVGEKLVRERGVKLLITGGAGEKDLVKDLESRFSVPVINLAGRTDLGQLAVIMGRCRLVLGVDSGPLHLAVAMGAPTVHLFGPVDPKAFGPWGPEMRHRVVRSDQSCIPCNRLDYSREELEAHRCVYDISTNQVLSVAEDLLDSGARGHVPETALP